MKQSATNQTIRSHLAKQRLSPKLLNTTINSGKPDDEAQNLRNRKDPLENDQSPQAPVAQDNNIASHDEVVDYNIIDQLAYNLHDIGMTPNNLPKHDSFEYRSIDARSIELTISSPQRMKKTSQSRTLTKPLRTSKSRSEVTTSGQRVRSHYDKTNHIVLDTLSSLNGTASDLAGSRNGALAPHLQCTEE